MAPGVGPRRKDGRGRVVAPAGRPDRSRPGDTSRRQCQTHVSAGLRDYISVAVWCGDCVLALAVFERRRVLPARGCLSVGREWW